MMSKTKKDKKEAKKEYDRNYKKRRYSEDPEYRSRVKEYSRDRRKNQKLIDSIGDDF